MKAHGLAGIRAQVFLELEPADVVADVPGQHLFGCLILNPPASNNKRRLGLAPALLRTGSRNKELGRAPAYLCGSGYAGLG